MVAAIAHRMPLSRPGLAGKRVIERWKVFGPGRWNGETWSRSDLEDLAENFRRFRRPASTNAPAYVPFVSINHEDETVGLCWGDVLACGVDPADGWFWVTFDVDPTVAELLDSGKLRAASIEWWNTRNKRDRELSGFFLTPDAKPIGLILRAVTLCGAMVQAVKGQPRAPRSRPKTGADWIQRFDDAVRPGRTLVEIPNVDEQTIQKIMSADPSITPEMAEKIAAALAGGAAPAETPPPDGAGMDGGGAMPVGDEMPAGMDTGAALKQVYRDLSAVRKKLAAKEAEEAKQANAASDQFIQKFHDAVLAERKATPAEAARILSDLKVLTPSLRETSVGVLTKQLGLTGKAAPKADRQFSDGSAARTGPAGEQDIRSQIMRNSIIGRQILAGQANADPARN